MNVTGKILTGMAVGLFAVAAPVMAGPHGGPHHDSGLDLAAGIVRIVGDVLAPRRTVVVAPAPTPVVVAPAPVVVTPPVPAPAPIYVAPQPVVVAQPVYMAPQPVYVAPRPAPWHGGPHGHGYDPEPRR